MLKRIWLIIKMAFKSFALLFGMSIYAIWMVDLYNIIVTDDNRFMAIFKSAMSIPPMELIGNYAQDMFFRGDHAAAMIFPCIIMSIPLLPLIFILLFGGMGSTMGYLANNLVVTYVYVDSGEYAYSEIGTGPIMFAFSLLLRIMLVIVIINIAPFLLLITLAINVIQLFWIRIGGKKHE